MNRAFKILGIIALLIFVSLLVGCGKNETRQVQSSIGNPLIKDETKDSITCIDADGNEVLITKRPKRALVAHNSMLDLWYLAGGKSVGRPDSKTFMNIPEEAKDVQTIGQVTNLNTEKILALQPDLVILNSGIEKHRAMKELLDQSKIENILLGYENYDDFENLLDLFAKINDDKKVMEDVVPTVHKRVTAVLNQCPKENYPKVLVLFTSSRSIQCETSKAHTGRMVELIGGQNIVDEIPVAGETRVQFSMERILQKDPDVVLVVTMGQLNDIQKRMQKDLESNQAWAGLTAVKQGNVHYLPSEYFLYKPNTQYPEAFEYLAKILYPEIFKE